MAPCAAISGVWQGIGGSFYDGQCAIPTKLSTVCARLGADPVSGRVTGIPDAGYRLTVGADRDEGGCAYSSSFGGWPLAAYTPTGGGSAAPGTIKVLLRHQDDCAIKASDLTKGCSTCTGSSPKSCSGEACLGVAWDSPLNQRVLGAGYFFCAAAGLCLLSIPFVRKR